jgi:hypothetical protein
LARFSCSEPPCPARRPRRLAAPGEEPASAIGASARADAGRRRADADRAADGGRAGRARAAANHLQQSQRLGVARTVEIDTTGGPGFGFEHFKSHDFLREGESC